MPDFERATQYDETARPYYAWEVACELTEHVARLDLPYKIVTACGTKALAMVAEMQSLGVDPSALAIVRSYIPDLSAEGIQRAYEDGESMQAPACPSTSFSGRLEASVGQVDVAARSVVFNGMRFSEGKSGDTDVILVERASRDDRVSGQDNFVEDKRWELPLPDERVSFCNHTTAAVRTLGKDGKVVLVAIDPSYDTTEPLDIDDWKESQNFSGAIVLSGNIADYGRPLRVHLELMNDEQRRRFQATLEESDVASANPTTLTNTLIAQPELYETVMSHFFNLQTESAHAHARAADHYDYALYLARVVLTGKEHDLPVGTEASRRKVGEILGRLAPVMAYQNWLEQTER